MKDCKLPAIVLVRPRNPNNIGAAARAMANFGFAHLRVVAVHPPVWEEALRAAVGAEALLRRARVFGGLAEAVSDRTRVLATSCMKARSPRMHVVPLPGLSLGPKAAVVFGPEKTGLSAKDMEHCDAVLRIPTAESCPSMNLVAAVAAVCYELAGRGRAAGPAFKDEGLTGAELERLVEAAEAAFLRVGYRGDLSAAQRKSRVRRLLRRRGVLRDEAGFLFELARRAAGL